MSYRELVASEKARFERAPMRELRNISVALAIHCWGNTLEEKARRDAIDQIVSERLRARWNSKRA